MVAALSYPKDSIQQAQSRRRKSSPLEAVTASTCTSMISIFMTLLILSKLVRYLVSKFNGFKMCLTQDGATQQSSMAACYMFWEAVMITISTMFIVLTLRQCSGNVLKSATKMLQKPEGGTHV
jgi:hypothetical protein